MAWSMLICQVVTFTTTQLLQKSGRFQTVWTKNCSSEGFLDPVIIGVGVDCMQ